MMKKFLTIPVFLLLAGCNNATDINKTPTTPMTDSTKTLLVDAKLYDCVGVAPMKCMRVKELPAGEWTLFYQNIEGFDYQSGTEYTLKVNVTKVANPPADSSSLKYSLVEIIDKK